MTVNADDFKAWLPQYNQSGTELCVILTNNSDTLMATRYHFVQSLSTADNSVDIVLIGTYYDSSKDHFSSMGGYPIPFSTLLRITITAENFATGGEIPLSTNSTTPSSYGMVRYNPGTRIVEMDSETGLDADNPVCTVRNTHLDLEAGTCNVMDTGKTIVASINQDSSIVELAPESFTIIMAWGRFVPITLMYTTMVAGNTENTKKIISLPFHSVICTFEKDADMNVASISITFYGYNEQLQEKKIVLNIDPNKLPTQNVPLTMEDR